MVDSSKVLARLAAQKVVVELTMAELEILRRPVNMEVYHPRLKMSDGDRKILAKIYDKLETAWSQ